MMGEVSRRPGQEGEAAGVVSSGQHDPGKVSYGAFQLASSKQGAQQVLAFLKSPYGARWLNRFAGMDPTEPNGAFAQTWKAIARAEPQAFFAAQYAYIQQTHYQPAVAFVLAKSGVNLDAQSVAVRNVVWSMAVQHGRGKHAILQAVQALKGVVNPSDPNYQKALIDELFKVRRAYVHNNSQLSPRYAREQRDALAMVHD